MVTDFVQSSAPLQSISESTLALKQVWETIQPDSCPYSYNFHMHTICSDGRMKPEELIKQAVTLELKGLAITDHHAVSAYEVAQSWLESQQQQFPSQTLPHLWIGTEITSCLLGIEVHILGYSFDPRHARLQHYLQGKAPQGSDAQAANVITAFHQAGGLAVLAHPERYKLPAEKLIPVAAEIGIDGVETYYAYNNPSPWKPSPKETQKVKELTATYGLLNTCGTDTHGLSLLQRL
jgi:predicted metal-dependent phosphoesterase TrpH